MNVAIIFLTACDSKMQGKQQGTSPTIATCAARSGQARSVVLAWQDTCGRTKFVAEPQQNSFFNVIDFDQLYAQATSLTLGDPFGHTWCIATDKEQVAPEEM